MKIFAILDGPPFENLGFSVLVGKIGGNFTESTILQNLFFFPKNTKYFLTVFFKSFQH